MNLVPPSLKLPLTIGRIHFVGIGGIGMSGIAEVLHNLGYSVCGSDIAESANVERLRAEGITVRIGHAAQNVADASVVVVSTAVKADNPEVIAARAAGIPVVPRAEMLAELVRFKLTVAVAGTHGKTTTTSMMGAVLEAAGKDPTVINGGIINAYGTNTRLGDSEWMVVEADESDGTFIRIAPTIAVITNMDPEHLDHWGTFDNVRAAYKQFIERIPFFSFAALCIDHPEVAALAARVQERRLITYGTSPQADVRAVNVQPAQLQRGIGFTYDVEISDRLTGTARTILGVRLPMPGIHNVRNSLAAVAVAATLDLPTDVIVQAFQDFQGVKRRFTTAGQVDGVTIIDDYGHHPVEIAATLAAAREVVTMEAKGGRVIAVVQPHRYSRVHDLMDQFCTCFHHADTVLVADIYTAGEDPLPGVTAEALTEGIRAHGHRDARYLGSLDTLARTLPPMTQPGDLVVCLGAGSITRYAHALAGEWRTARAA